MSNSDDRKDFYTSDLSLAAFLMMKGLKLLSGTKLTSGKFKFEFDNKDETANSCCCIYKIVEEIFKTFSSLSSSFLLIVMLVIQYV